MNNICYKPLIEDMCWSYSRIKAFSDCKYRWFLKYIRYPGLSGKPMFFTSYGIFMHELLAAFYKGEKSASELQLEYLKNFRLRVDSAAPNISVFTNYFNDGIQYLREIKQPQNTILSVEGKINFSLYGKPFIGYIDLLERDKFSSIVLTDNKSRALKPRSSRVKPTKADAELDEYLMQLYLYSAYVKEAYGEFPNTLCFNCFRKGVLIEEHFDESAYSHAIDWFFEKTQAIAEETEFAPNIEYFKCRYLCELQDYCDYYTLFKG